jgi:hypothetical protein
MIGALELSRDDRGVVAQIPWEAVLREVAAAFAYETIVNSATCAITRLLKEASAPEGSRAMEQAKNRSEKQVLALAVGTLSSMASMEIPARITRGEVDDSLVDVLREGVRALLRDVEFSDAIAAEALRRVVSEEATVEFSRRLTKGELQSSRDPLSWKALEAFAVAPGPIGQVKRLSELWRRRWLPKAVRVPPGCEGPAMLEVAKLVQGRIRAEVAPEAAPGADCGAGGAVASSGESEGV